VSVSELATELHVSVNTIETHQMRMKEKLALHGARCYSDPARGFGYCLPFGIERSYGPKVL